MNDALPFRHDHIGRVEFNPLSVQTILASWFLDRLENEDIQLPTYERKIFSGRRPNIEHNLFY